MKRLAFVGLLLGALGSASSACAADAMAIAKANLCMTCHAVDKGNGMAPSFAEMRQRYKGKPMEAELADKIRQGSVGKWGANEMPAQLQLSPADARTIAKWIVNP